VNIFHEDHLFKNCKTPVYELGEYRESLYDVKAGYLLKFFLKKKVQNILQT